MTNKSTSPTPAGPESRPEPPKELKFNQGGPELYDRLRLGWAEPRQLPANNRPIKFGRRAKIWTIVTLVVVALFIIIPALVNFWIDLMWFDEVGQTGVFWTRFWMPLLTFLGAFVLAFGVLLGNVSLARRFSAPGATSTISSSAPSFLQSLSRFGLNFLNWLFIAGAVVISLVLAAVAAGNWQTILSYFKAASWSDTETIFNRSTGFYLFEAPFYGFLQGWSLVLLALCLVGTLFVYFMRAVLAGQQFKLTPAVKTHASALGAVFLGLCALGYQISNWNLVYSQRGRTFGASATDVDAQAPANNILTFVILAAALLLLANIFIKKPHLGRNLLIAAGTIWLGSHLIIGVVYPALYQNFSVKPNEITKETPYIANTIKMTRQAFGLVPGQDLTVVPFQGTAQLTQKDIAQNPYIQENARLWDYNRLQGIYDLTQTLRQYYDFSDIDIDRYNIALNDNKPAETQIMLGTRELKQEGLAAQTWQSVHLQYTHGYGIQASPVNQVDYYGRPVDLISQSFPFSSTLLPVSQPRIYFGEQNNAYYSVVNTGLEEIDYPFQTQNAPDAKFKYDGKGGIQLSNIFVRAAFAYKLGDINLLLSSAITDNSKLIFRRTLLDRVQTIAPFLSYDSDPYMVVANNRLYWVVDAFTSTGLYPHSDRLANLNGQPANYVRNSVKVVIDAYDGTTTFYLMDTPSVDPLAQTYANIYPGLFTPFSQMPAELKAHIRYPETLLRIQSRVSQNYHVSDPVTFYNNQDLWQVPSDPRPTEALSRQTARAIEPYYLVTRPPGEQQNEVVLINIFQPQNRLNLVSWMAARMDGANYGKLVVYNFDPSINIDGPAQFYAKVQAMPDFSRQQSLLNTGSSNLLPGPIIIIPVDNAVLYEMPYYLQGSTTALPQLQFVAVEADNRVFVAQPTANDDRRSLLTTALNDVFSQGQQVNLQPGQNGQPTPGITPGITTPVPTLNATPPVTGGSGPTVGPNQTATVNELVRSMQTHLNSSKAAFARGDTATGTAELNAANADLARIDQILGH